ncbi:MAG TPA: ABC transporter permease [Ktedonobacterales bacterium]|nr:ABC transporter permease [Ktedonobacterales bacterium]
MSSISTVAPLTATQRAIRPRFWGLTRGELFKIMHQRMNWVMLPILAFLCSVRWLVLPLGRGDIKSQIAAQPYDALHTLMADNLGVYRVFVGFFLIILTARAIGLDFQQGTIRIILARGVGRLQLLFAKVLALVGVALAVTVGVLLLNLVLGLAFISGIEGNLNALSAINSTFWADTGSYLLTVFISMGVTMLLAVATTVLGRSLAVGLGLALVFFPADNIGSQVLYLVYRLTGSDFWLNVTAYLLGPNLNIMPGQIVLNHVGTIGATPWVAVDGGHTLLITLLYAIVFAAIAIILTWRRDVME